MRSINRPERDLSSENLLDEFQELVNDTYEKQENPEPVVEDLYSRMKDKDNKSNPK